MRTDASASAIVSPVATPLGTYTAAFTERGLACLTFPADSANACVTWLRRQLPASSVVIEPAPGGDARVAELEQQLAAYFAGELTHFSVPLDVLGTPFQQAVYRALIDIPYGETRTYRQIAVAVGRPNAIRAAGAANGANPIPIIVPCHRVVGSDGTLTGYGGGLELKARLLELERRRG